MNEFDVYASMLSQELERAVQTDDAALKDDLASLWGETWGQVERKYRTEGSTWYVWWQDGVNAYYNRCQEAE